MGIWVCQNVLETVYCCQFLKMVKTCLSSDTYGPISLASNLSKVLEHIVLAKCSQYLVTNQLQFGFKSGSSTLCTSLVKNNNSRYILIVPQFMVASWMHKRHLTWLFSLEEHV